MKKIISILIILIGTLNIVCAESEHGEFIDDFYDITIECDLEEKNNISPKKSFITGTDEYDMTVKALFPDLARAYSGFNINPLTKRISAWATTAAPSKYQVSVRGDMYKNSRHYNGAASTRGYGKVHSSTPPIEYRKGDGYEFRSFHNCWNSAGVKVYSESLYITKGI